MTLADQTPVELAIRRLKVGVLQARRLASWLGDAPAWPRPAVDWNPAAYPVRIWQGSAPLHRPDADPVLDAGKRINVALAATCFDGVVVSPTAPLSFWRALGRITAARGFRPGMELRAGCIVPSLGGGICLLSNALFAMAAELGWTIHERHGHTIALDLGPSAVPRELPPKSRAAPSTDPTARLGIDLGQRPALDATVMWPHVDLRIAPRDGAVRLSVTIVGDELIVAADASAASPWRVALEVERGRTGERLRVRVRRVVSTDAGAPVDERWIVDDDKAVLPTLAAHTCTTCDQTGCHARIAAP